jgi:hypothetical protein
MGGYKRSNSLKAGGDSGSSSKVSKKGSKDLKKKSHSRVSSDEDNEEPKKGTT